MSPAPDGQRWGAELVNRVRTMLTDGLSRGEIAEVLSGRLGRHITRNAVCGVVDRHIAENERPPPKARAPKPMPSKRKRNVHNPAGSPNKRYVSGHGPRPTPIKPPPPPVPLPPPLLARNLDIMQLKDGDCRYPYGSGPYTFCGLATQPGSSYCRYHHRACWVPR